MDRYDRTLDPRGLIFEAYRMDIGLQDCRSIFLDWALGQPADAIPAQIEALLARHGAGDPEHPMTAVLREGLDAAAGAPGRKGGRRGRSARQGRA